jgi:hypothetical protein
MKLSAVFLMASMLLSTAYGSGDHGRVPARTELPNTQLMVHRAPNINLSVTNFGFLGSQEGEFEDIEGYFDPAPGAMFPARSSLEYLFQGGIWIGAEIDTVDQNGNPALDTVVSAGVDGWWGNHFELYPEEFPGGGLWREEVMADEEIYGVYYDTNSSIRPDPFTQRPHIPMGLKISQHSFAWSSPGYDDFVILEFILQNIGSRFLHNAYFGIYWDGDVFHYSEGGQLGATDDICGYSEYGDQGIGWLADNDGEPQNGQFDSLSPAGAIGLTLVGSSLSGLETNFNWWTSNINGVYDWGPRRIENYNGPFPCGGNGTPCGDIVFYEMMSNGEKDYGSIWCDLDYWENNGWIPRPYISPTLADGFDSKYLISFGAFDLPAGEIETLTVAVIGGEQFHTDPLNFENYLEGHTNDSSSIAQFYNNLGFGRLLEMADSISSFYQHGYANIPIGPPSAFRVTAWGENFVGLGWRAMNRPGLHEYRIYRGTEPGIYDPQKITPDGFSDTVFVDSDVQNNIRYYYVITSAKISGLEGGYSVEASINTGQPQTPTGLVAERGNSRINLSWDYNPESDILGYLIYKSEGPGNYNMLIDTVRTNHFTDTYVGNGLEFFYYITAIDSFMNVSFGSDTASAIPMGFDSGILLISCTSANPDINPDYDSMAAFYENILANYQHQVVYFTPRALPEVADYSTLIYAKELAAGYQRFHQGRDMLESYLTLGGNILLAGTRQLTPHAGAEGVYTFDADEIQNQFFNLGAAEFPNPYANTEFTGGASTSPDFNDFVLDYSRISRIIYPPGLPEGRLNGIGALIPNDSSEVIYSYVATNPDTSNYHGRPIGIIHQTDTYNTAVLEFPLYYVVEPVSYQVLHQILNNFGEVPTGIDDNSILLTKSTGLVQNYPNPFNNMTTLKYNLTQAGKVAITIYNILGQRVAEPVNEYQQAGTRSIAWNAGRLPSGIYFARMKTEDYSGSIKLLLLK